MISSSIMVSRLLRQQLMILRRSFKAHQVQQRWWFRCHVVEISVIVQLPLMKSQCSWKWGWMIVEACILSVLTRLLVRLTLLKYLMWTEVRTTLRNSFLKMWIKARLLLPVWIIVEPDCPPKARNGSKAWAQKKSRNSETDKDSHSSVSAAKSQLKKNVRQQTKTRSN